MEEMVQKPQYITQKRIKRKENGEKIQERKREKNVEEIQQ